MLIQRKALSQEIPALERISNVNLCEHLAALGLPVDGVEERPEGVVLDVDITANRGDACSHRGIARDLAARLGYTLTRLPYESVTEGEVGFPIRLEADACPLYATAILELGERGETPREVAEFLTCMGSNAKNMPSVDASNELLHRYGQPTHAFDFDTLQGAVIVRWAKAGEMLVTLDGVERKLTEADLIIADEKGPIALAGVMGGDRTKVTDTTRRVLLESAYFDPKVVRRMAHRHGLHSDASFRFGRGTDLDMAKPVRDMLVRRLESWNHATLQSAWTVGAGKQKAKPVILKGSTLARIAGEILSLEDAAEWLRRLGCEVELEPRNLEIIAPSWRHDLTLDVDFAEEVLRLRGYDRIPMELPPLEGSPVTLSLAYQKRKAVAQRLAQVGFMQTVTLGFISPELDEPFATPENPKEGRTLTNPLGQDYSVMRASLLGSLKAAALNNVRQGARCVRLFEMAPIYQSSAKGPQEQMALALVMAGNLGGEDYLSPARGVCAADLLGVVRDLGLTRDIKVQDLGEGLLGLELPLEWLPEKDTQVIPTFKPFSRFPTVERDLSLLVNLDQGYRELESAMAQRLADKAGAIFQGVACVDVFRHKSLPAGRQAWLMRMRFQAMDRTLTGEEVDGYTQEALAAACALGCELRK